MGLLAIFPSWGVLMGHCAGEIAVYGPSGYFYFMGCANGPLCRQNSCIWALRLFFLLWGVLMGHCASKIAVYGPSGYFYFMGCAKRPLAGKIAVYGPSGYFSFMGCANGPLSRQNSCIWALWLFFLYGVCSWATVQAK
jgi:hypothetical protein